MQLASVDDWFRAVSNREYRLVSTNLFQYKQSRDSKGETALMWAARHGDLELVHILAPAEHAMVNSEGYTSIMLAAAGNYYEICKVLAPFEARDTLPDGRTALMLAAEAGSLESVQVLARYNRFSFDKRGRTALTIAAENNRVDCAAELLDGVHGRYCYDSRMALIIAAEKHYEDLAKLLADYISEAQPSLLQENTNVSDKDDTNLLAMDTSNIVVDVQSDFAELRKLLKLYKEEAAAKDLALLNMNSLLVEADTTDARSANQSLSEASRLSSSLVTRTGLFDSIGPGNSPGSVVSMGRVANLERLLRDVPQPYQNALMTASLTRMYESDDCMTAMMGAAYLGHVAVVEALMDTEAARRNKTGHTALMIAIQYDHQKVAELLIPLEFGIVDNEGWTALMLAAQRGNIHLVTQLIDHEAGAQANDGWTALMSAAFNGHLECTRILASVEGGIVDYHGKSASQYAQEAGHMEIARLLLDITGI